MVVMRYLLLLVFSAAAIAQPLSLGIKVGVPLTDAFHAASTGDSSYIAHTRRFLIGPTAELELPLGFSVELDVLYRSQSYRSQLQGNSTTLSGYTTSGAWEFPVMAKYKLFHGPVRPYVLGGLAFNRLSGVTETLTCTGSGCTSGSSITTGTPGELDHRTSVGIVLGGGLQVNALVVKLSPEIRYTGWTLPNFSSPSGAFKSIQNQAEVMVGINF